MLPVIILLLEFVILALFKSTGTTDVGNFFASVLILIHSLGMIASFSLKKRLRPYSKYLTIGLLLRILILLIDVLAYPSIILPNGHADEDMFYHNAINYAETGYIFRGFYPKVMGLLFRYIGYNRLFGQYISMICAIVAFVYLAYALNEFDLNTSVQMKVFRVAILLPNCALLSAMFLREAVIYMFLSMSLFYFARWTRDKREYYYILAMLLVLPAAAFHSGTIAVLAGYIVIRAVYDNKKEIVKMTASNIMITVIIAFLAVFVINRSGGQLTSKFNGVDSIEDIANTIDRGDSSYAQYVGNSNNPISFILYSPVRLLFFLFSPLPGMWRGLADVIAFCFSSLYYLVVLWSVIKFLKKHNEKHRVTVIALFIVALATVFVFAWGTSNAGTATRHRDKSLILFALLWALSLDGLQGVSAKEPFRSRYRRRLG